MNNRNDNIEKTVKGKSFTRRLDFYWKYIAVYALAIIFYALIKGSFDDRTLTFMLIDPVVILLAVFILLTAFGLLIETSKKKEIIVGDSYIVFSNRFRKKAFTKNDIERIYIGREHAKYTGKFRIIKIKLKKRKRPIIIRPSSYWNEQKLISKFGKLKRNITHR
jgi:hypothetical protein